MWALYFLALLGTVLIASTASALFEGTERRIMVGINAAAACIWSGLIIYEAFGALRAL